MERRREEEHNGEEERGGAERGGEEEREQGGRRRGPQGGRFGDTTAGDLSLPLPQLFAAGGGGSASAGDLQAICLNSKTSPESVCIQPLKRRRKLGRKYGSEEKKGRGGIRKEGAADGRKHGRGRDGGSDGGGSVRPPPSQAARGFPRRR